MPVPTYITNSVYTVIREYGCMTGNDFDIKVN